VEVWHTLVHFSDHFFEIHWVVYGSLKRIQVQLKSGREETPTSHSPAYSSVKRCLSAAGRSRLPTSVAGFIAARIKARYIIWINRLGFKAVAQVKPNVSHVYLGTL
jgi:hypothetical protein